MAGAPKTYIDEFYAVQESHKAETAKYHNGVGRPNRNAVISILVDRGVSFSQDTPTNQLSAMLRVDREAELAPLQVFRTPDAKHVESKPMTARGLAVRNGRLRKAQEAKARALYESMANWQTATTSIDKPKRTRKVAA